MTSRDIVVAGPVWTPIGAYNGTLKGTPAAELGAIAVAAALKRSGLAPEKIGSVVLGNVVQAGPRMNPARQAAVAGGLPVAAPARPGEVLHVDGYVATIERTGKTTGVVTMKSRTLNRSGEVIQEMTASLLVQGRLERAET